MARDIPQYGFQLFSQKKGIPVRLSSSRCGINGAYENLTSMFDLGLAHRNVGRVARTEGLRRHVSSEILSSCQRAQNFPSAPVA